MSWQSVFRNNPSDLRYKTRAAFMLPGRRGWSWITWEHREPSKHAAIITKGRELGAQGWDMGNADHYSMADYPAGRGFSNNPVARRWHWVEDAREVVVFVGSEQDARRYYLRNYRTRELHYLHASVKEGPRPVVGQVWR